MEYHKMFKYLMVENRIDQESITGELLRDIVLKIEEKGHEALVAKTEFEAEIAIIKDAAIGCLMISFDQESDRFSALNLIRFVRNKGFEIPVFIISEKEQIKEITIEHLNEIRGYIHPKEETATYNF